MPYFEDATTLASVSYLEATKQKVEIYFKIKERGNLRPAGSLWVDPSDIGELERVVKKYRRKEIDVCDKKWRPIKVETCFAASIADGENTLYLMPAWERDN